MAFYGDNTNGTFEAKLEADPDTAKPGPMSQYKFMTGVKDVVLQPGNTSVYGTSRTQEWKLNRFTDLFQDAMNDATLVDRHSAGRGLMFSLEKALDLGDSDGDIKVNYQLDSTYTMSYRYERKSVPMPVYDSKLAPVNVTPPP